MRERHGRAARRHRRNTHTLAARGRRQIERERFEAVLDESDVHSGLAHDLVGIVTERYAKDVVLDIDAGLARVVVSRQRQREGQGEQQESSGPRPELGLHEVSLETLTQRQSAQAPVFRSYFTSKLSVPAS